MRVFGFIFQIYSDALVFSTTADRLLNEKKGGNDFRTRTRASRKTQQIT